MKRKLSSLQKATLLLIIALLACLLPLPYGIYTIVRLGTAIVMACWTVRFYSLGKITMAIVCGGVAILFQPFIKITLDRLSWNIIDVTVAIFLLIVFFKVDLQKP